MNRFGELPAAAERGRWLAELAQVVAEAQRLARALSVARGSSAETDDLYARLELIRIEIDSLRRGGWATRSTETDPLWTNLFPLDRRSKF